MALPVYLAMTAAEISACGALPATFAWMACHFSPGTQGLSNLPAVLPPGAMLILNDRDPIQGHSADLVACQLLDAVSRLECESVLLDFQRPPETASMAVVEALVRQLPCPVAVSEGFATGFDCPVFISPGPLHIPVREHLAPWQGREIWLEAALTQQTITVTESGAQYASVFPTDHLQDGFYDKMLCCNYRTNITDSQVEFTLFDTPQTLLQKLELARPLGATRAVGLYQELSRLRTEMHCE